MRYAIACSLTKDCIAPVYKNYPQVHHQYDVSLMNLLAYQAFQNISRCRYFLKNLELYYKKWYYFSEIG